MGADFIGCWAPACELTPKRRKILEELVENMTDEEAENINDLGYVNSQDDVLSAIDDFANTDSSREADFFMLPEMSFGIYVTGGMSYGDPPTDKTTTFWLLSEMSLIWARLTEWAKEDEIKRRKELEKEK